jgi:hypothetical protein
LIFCATGSLATRGERELIGLFWRAKALFQDSARLELKVDPHLIGHWRFASFYRLGKSIASNHSKACGACVRASYANFYILSVDQRSWGGSLWRREIGGDAFSRLAAMFHA